MMKFLLVILIAITLADPRRQFGVTFPRNNDLPQTQASAVSKNWIKIEDSCEGVKFISPQKDLSNIVVFDKSGKLAGINVGVNHTPSEPMKSRYYFEKTFEGRPYWALEGYFVDPSTICGTRTAGPFGDRVWWKSTIHDGGFLKLPLTQQEAASDPKWVIGTCILGMGKHYWYDISKDMSCNDFTPFFVMYNGGHLTTFAVGFGLDRLVEGPNSRFEHAPKFVVRANFRPETLPQCLMEDKTKVSTMHFFFTSMLSNRCQAGDELLEHPMDPNMKM